MLVPQPIQCLRKVVVSGLGEVIGTVIHVETDPERDRLRLFILEEGAHGDEDAHVREVDWNFVARIDGDTIHLKGPREGFHITPLRVLYQPG